MTLELLALYRKIWTTIDKINFPFFFFLFGVVRISANLAVDMVGSVHFALITKFKDVTLTYDDNVIELSVHAGHCSMFFLLLFGISQAAGSFLVTADLPVVSRMISEDIGECIATND